MNKTQKGAWLTVGGSILTISMLIYIVPKIWQSIHQGVMPGSTSTRFVVLLLGLLTFGWMGGWLVYYQRSQSPMEVESDERDRLIKKRAAEVGFVS